VASGGHGLERPERDGTAGSASFDLQAKEEAAREHLKQLMP
jgi:hypothetical protein